MNWFKSLFKSLFCKHEYEFVRNIYGDEINWCGGCRSIWRCKKCGKIEYKENLYEESKQILCNELNNLYKEYYKNKYKNWLNLRKNTLNTLKEEMINNSKNGQCWIDFILVCEEKYNDKNYYDKWFDENKLKYNYELYCQNEKCLEVNKYKYHIHWNYN